MTSMNSRDIYMSETIHIVIVRVVMLKQTHGMKVISKIYEMIYKNKQDIIIRDNA